MLEKALAQHTHTFTRTQRCDETMQANSAGKAPHRNGGDSAAMLHSWRRREESVRTSCDAAKGTSLAPSSRVSPLHPRSASPHTRVLF